MKLTYSITLFLLFFSVTNAQTIESISVTSTDNQTLDITLEVCYGYGIGFLGAVDNVEGNEIDLAVCYQISSVTIIDCDLRTITVPIDTEIETYTLHAEVYKSFTSTGCTDSTLTDLVTIELSSPFTDSIFLSNREVNLNKDITIYPNPVSDILFFDRDNSVQLLAFSLFNISGSKVKEISSPFDELNLNEINAGVYLLNIKTNKGDLVKRIIIE